MRNSLGTAWGKVRGQPCGFTSCSCSSFSTLQS